VIATADSAATDQVRQTVRLVTGDPQLTGRGPRPFALDGTVIDIFGKAGAIERLLAQGNAHGVSDSTQMSGDTIDIRMSAGRVDTVALRGPGRVRATAPDRDIVADRIDLMMPGQQLERLVAVGRARVETRPDSTVRSAERDWLEGDTVIAEFDTTARTDTARQPPLRSLLARGGARSYYQVAAQNPADSLPSINYVTGERIVVAFRTGEVREVSVFGGVRGLSLEPVRGDTTRATRRPPRSGSHD
jgi:hypothetical protein